MSPGFTGCILMYVSVARALWLGAQGVRVWLVQRPMLPLRVVDSCGAHVPCQSWCNTLH